MEWMLKNINFPKLLWNNQKGVLKSLKCSLICYLMAYVGNENCKNAQNKVGFNIMLMKQSCH